ncbi:MAG: aminotransferase class I/II-fold pyridoxal phosphate-dependent enzyme [Thermoleophilia bacterium]|nr:aminotransferase class I/II-fold pyridoxal phosphate-dependent enzyme [Thermoleophilia bacterium]
MNAFRSALLWTGRTSIGSLTIVDSNQQTPGTAPIDLFDRARNHDRAEIIAAARDHDMLPFFRLLEGPAGPVVRMEGAERIMLGSNNYLGLTGDARVIAGARDALEKYGTALTGSRLLNGTIETHVQLESEIAEWMGVDDALVFTTGYQANLGALSALLEAGDTVICDAGDHASLLDGIKLSGAKVRPYRHGRLDKLETMLDRARGDGGGVLVVVDGVYSMEGDICDLPRVAELVKAYGARLMVDEAHGCGVLGARGAGACELLGVEDQVDLRMGTFSKSLASCGGFIAGESEIIDYLRLYARSFLFTASAVPAAIGAALAAVRVAKSGEGRALMARVLGNAEYLWTSLKQHGLRVIDPGAELGERYGVKPFTPIVPILIGEDWEAAVVWKKLYEAGVYCNVAMHPAVPHSGALLRTSVMATHERAHLDRAIEAIMAVAAEHPAMLNAA